MSFSEHSMTTKLKKYKSKRRFKVTPEPTGARKKKRSKKLIFVVQKHDASHLHYDLRLESEGVLKSWAIPKGFSLDPQEKHLAVMVEDHPYDYAWFEGVIPEGEYGAGPVMVWDIGTYTITKEINGKPISMAAALKRGIIEFELSGKKLKGKFALVRFKGSNGRQWLLIKMQDKFAKVGKNLNSPRAKSALSGRTLAHIERGEPKKRA